jgi:hypothetical protein
MSPNPDFNITRRVHAEDTRKHVTIVCTAYCAPLFIQIEMCTAKIRPIALAVAPYLKAGTIFYNVIITSHTEPLRMLRSGCRPEARQVLHDLEGSLVDITLNIESIYNGNERKHTFGENCGTLVRVRLAQINTNLGKGNHAHMAA